MKILGVEGYKTWSCLPTHWVVGTSIFDSGDCIHNLVSLSLLGQLIGGAMKLIGVLPTPLHTASPGSDWTQQLASTRNQ